MFTGIVNFHFPKMRKIRIFWKMNRPLFEKLMFTGKVNFDFSKMRKIRIFWKVRTPTFRKVNVYRLGEFRLFENAKNAAFFGKVPRPLFEKLMSAGIVNFDFPKMRKIRIFWKIPRPLSEKLMSTGIVNFDFPKMRKSVGIFWKILRPFSKS